MSPYRYTCGRCDEAAPPTPTRAGAEAQRAYHQATVHGGLAPPGERIDRVHGDDARDPNSRYVSTRAALVGLGLLAAASVISRVLGR